MRADAVMARHPNWREALADAVRQMPVLASREDEVHLVMLFASAAFTSEFGELVAEARALTRARVLVGCSGQGVIGQGLEIEDEPALALLALSMPGAALRAVHVSPDEFERWTEPQTWHRMTGAAPAEARAWLVFVDPFTLDAEGLLGALSHAYPGVPLAGGLASGHFQQQRTHLFLNDRVYDHGAVLLALAGPYRLETVVSQGAAPIGQPWTITAAQGNVIETIGQRPAYQVLIDTLRALPSEMQRRASRNLLVGLAMDEHREELRRGDFLIRNLVGLIPETGALAVGALPRIGQTVQFQLRDPAAAAEELRELLQQAKARLGDRRPLAAVLCSCNGRGIGMFGRPHQDAQAVVRTLGPVPLAGLFCNGEIGPVGGQPYLHGFTASLALVVADE
jgi:small ligand-binding sensory domain FIST